MSSAEFFCVRFRSRTPTGSRRSGRPKPSRTPSWCISRKTRRRSRRSRRSALDGALRSTAPAILDSSMPRVSRQTSSRRSACDQRSAAHSRRARSSPGQWNVAIISHALWLAQFGADSTVIGRVVQMDNIPTQIVGVMPAGFEAYHAGVDAWLPLQIDPASPYYTGQTAIGFGRLASGATMESATAELATLVPQMREQFNFSAEYGRGGTVVALRELLVGNVRQSAARSARRHGVRAAHCRRQPWQPDARRGDRSPARARGAPRARRVARTGGSAASRAECDARDRRRRSRNGDRSVRCADC